MTKTYLLQIDESFIGLIVKDRTVLVRTEPQSDRLDAAQLIYHAARQLPPCGPIEFPAKLIFNEDDAI